VTQEISRRAFLGATGAAAAAAALPARASSPASAWPAPAGGGAARPAAVGSANALRAVGRAAEILRGGGDPLDAVIEGVKIQELDPSDHTVGYAGLPNEEGVVQLDASCMHGPSRRAGAVAALEGIKTPSEVARLVLRHTDHVLLVGEGAKRFALSFGFEEEELLTPESRRMWLEWRARRGPDDDWLDPSPREPIVPRPTGTVTVAAVDARGDLASATSTSGLAYKIPGRVGDSPIIGAGQYTDNEVGAAGSTGRGEANLKVCGSFLTVEGMRRGLAPTDACLETLRRVVRTTEARLLGPDGRPTFDLTFYAISKRGEVGAASFYPGRYAAHDGREAALRDTAHLYPSPRSR
jgi:N4-(beta-N-acetylglucosaminyl)-L-asparaginase